LVDAFIMSMPIYWTARSRAASMTLSGLYELTWCAG
jgi:hypothetical protein